MKSRSQQECGKGRRVSLQQEDKLATLGSSSFLAPGANRWSGWSTSLSLRQNEKGARTAHTRPQMGVSVTVVQAMEAGWSTAGVKQTPKMRESLSDLSDRLPVSIVTEYRSYFNLSYLFTTMINTLCDECLFLLSATLCTASRRTMNMIQWTICRRKKSSNCSLHLQPRREGRRRIIIGPIIIIKNCFFVCCCIIIIIKKIQH